MSLHELQESLGHQLPSSTQRYAKITPKKLMKSYSDGAVSAELCEQVKRTEKISRVTIATRFHKGARFEWHLDG